MTTKKIVVGITGGAGFVGWHTECVLSIDEAFEINSQGRELFESDAELDNFVSHCDVIVHLAGVNRGTEEEIATTNVGLAQKLVDACRRAERKPHVIYSSTTHIAGTSLYGKSKKEAGEKLQQWATETGARFTNLILPHIFGENCRPFYNSAVATFCYQVANKEPAKVENDATLHLLHVHEVARIVADVIRNGRTGDIQPEGYAISVSKVLEKIKAFARSYNADVIPDMREEFDLRLFNTYRSYLFPAHYPKQLQRHTDNRGGLVEIIKSQNGGQTFFSTTKPGITRGDHYHLHKIERFLVVSGEAMIRVRRLGESKVHEFKVSGANPGYVDMPTMHTHNITNIGDQELVTVFWSHEIFDPESPDTYAEKVQVV